MRRRNVDADAASASKQACLGGAASSAAAVGVGARKSAARSARVTSVSCPTPQTNGMADRRTARTRRSSLNAHRSSSEPPPRHRIKVSTSACRFAISIAALSATGASAPWTGLG